MSTPIINDNGIKNKVHFATPDFQRHEKGFFSGQEDTNRIEVFPCSANENGGLFMKTTNETESLFSTANDNGESNSRANQNDMIRKNEKGVSVRCSQRHKIPIFQTLSAGNISRASPV